MLYNSKNEIIKKKYIDYLRGPKQYSDLTIDKKLQSLYRFDTYNNTKDYQLFNEQTAKGFQVWLKRQTFRGNLVGAGTIYHTLKDLQEFFVWLSQRPGYKSRIHNDNIQFLNPSKAIKSIALSRTPRLYPVDLNYVKRLVLSIKGQSELDMRDRAIISTIICTGMRAEAVSSLPMGCVNIDEMLIDQNPAKGVKTKNRKRITTHIIPLDSLFIEYIKEWHQFLKKQNVSSLHPFFPKAEISFRQNTFSFINDKISDHFIITNSRISAIIKKRCTEANEKYYSAHTLRHLHVYLVTKAAKTPEELKALSQNLGHSHVYTTVMSYGYIPENNQVELLKNLDLRRLS